MTVLPLILAFACMPFDTQPRVFDERGYHVQGAAAAEDALYLNQMEWLYKFDWTGRLLKKTKVIKHTGDLCLHGGELYTIAMGYDEGPWKGKSLIRAYGKDLDIVREAPAGRPADGIAVMNGVVYICYKPKFSKADRKKAHRGHDIGMFDAKTLAKKGEKTVDLGFDTVHGVQNMATDGTNLWFYCYAKDPAGPDLARLDANLNVTGAFKFPAGPSGQGLDVLPSGMHGGGPVFMHVRSRNIDDVPHGKSSHATIRFFGFDGKGFTEINETAEKRL